MEIQILGAHNLSHYFRIGPFPVNEHVQYVGPFILYHSLKYGNQRLYSWTKEDTKILIGNNSEDTPINLVYGKWQVGRNGKMVRGWRDKLAEKIDEMKELLLSLGISSLYELSRKNDKSQEAVLKLIRKVNNLKNCVGSDKQAGYLITKLVHHFFPGIIPVYDNEFIAKALQYHRRRRNVPSTLGSITDLYDLYYYWAIYEFKNISTLGEIKRIRNIMKKEYEKYIHPKLINRESLDAKIFEYCFIASVN